MLVYVDDIIVTRSTSGMISYLINLLGNESSLNDLDKLYYLLGIGVIYQNKGLFLNQTRYTITLLGREI